MSWVLVHFLVYFLFPTLLRRLLVYKGRSCLGINLVKSFAHPSRLIRVSWCLGKPRSWWSRHYLMFWSTIFHLKQLHLFIGITEYRNQRCSLLCDLSLKCKVNCPPFTISLRFWVEPFDACNSIPLHIQCKASYWSATWMNNWKHNDGILCRVSCRWWLKKYHLIVKY